LIPVYGAAAVRATDAYVIESVGIPGPVLMENAGRLTAQWLLERYDDALQGGALILCGRGNNGGDGYVIARHLALAGIRVEVAGQAGRHSPDASIYRGVCVHMGIPVDAKLSAEGFGLIVDAMLGTGLERNLRDDVAARVAMVNRFAGPVVAVDLPTGLHADSGAVMGDVVRATCTVTYGFLKPGLLLEPGADFVGELVLADIGLDVVKHSGPRATSAAHEGIEAPKLWVIEAQDVLDRLPSRPDGGHKGSNGHLAVLAGSPEKAGAAVLTANAAMRSGVGLVTLLLPRAAWARLEGLRPEVMVADVDALQAAAYTAFAVGPGIDLIPEAVERLHAVWRDETRPVVVDAEGLNALVDLDVAPGGPRVLTPHPGEAGRLLGRSSAEVQADRLAAVTALAVRAPALLKGRNTLICASGDAPWLNPTGGPQLSTAGSGDVLTGVIGALLAQGLPPVDAAVCGAFLHGLSVEGVGGPIVAGDIVNGLPSAFEGLHRCQSPFVRVGP